MRFEEGLANNGRDPVPLNFKDPFINPGEISKGKNTGLSQFGDTTTIDYPGDPDEDFIESKDIPQFLTNQKKLQPQNQKDEDLKRNIQELSQQIDRLSKTYSQKINISSEDVNPLTVAEAHGIEEESAPPKENTTNQPEVKTHEFLESFIRAQYNFYKNFDYSSMTEQ